MVKSEHPVENPLQGVFPPWNTPAFPIEDHPTQNFISDGLPRYTQAERPSEGVEASESEASTHTLGATPEYDPVSPIHGKKDVYSSFKGKLWLIIFFPKVLTLLAKSHLHRSGYGNRTALMRRSTLRQVPTQAKSRSPIAKRRPNEELLLRLREVVKEYLGEEIYNDMTMDGKYSSWKESKTEDLIQENTEKVVKFSVDFQFIGYT